MATCLYSMTMMSLAAVAVDFDTDVVPRLTKSGCNAAACHGASAGRGGFRLSLFGGDPAADFDEIVHRQEGRRINLRAAENSLLIAKPTGYLDHEGGVRLNQEDADVLIMWLDQGAQRWQIRQVVQLSTEPSDITLNAPNEFATLVVRARFDDGSIADVTRLALFWPEDPEAVEMDAVGRVTLRRPGQFAVGVQFGSQVVTYVVRRPLNDAIPIFADAARSNWIDDYIIDTLRRLRIPVSPPAGDGQLFRRLTLDLTGQLPVWEDVAKYDDDTRPDRYDRALDRILASPKFVDYWTFKLSGLLRSPGQDSFWLWIREQLRANRGWNETAAQLIMANGDCRTNGPANFHVVAPDPRGQAEYLSESLMGVRLRCANCHNHPFDAWTQADYHGLAAVFSKMSRGDVVEEMARGEVTNPVTGRPATPKIPGGRFLSASESPRQALADWLASRENPYFARALVNRLWGWLLGHGLIEPTDDLRASNPGSHPELLARLSRNFVHSGYDVQRTLREIAQSASYARSDVLLRENVSDNRFYSHALRRPFEPEVLVDAISDVSGVVHSYEGLPAGSRAIHIRSVRSSTPDLQVLGRCGRDESCAPKGGSTPGLTTRLHLLNGSVMNAQITSPEGRLARHLQQGASGPDVVQDYYTRALGRVARLEEAQFWERELGPLSAENMQSYEDFIWSLLNSREFHTNH